MFIDTSKPVPTQTYVICDQKTIIGAKRRPCVLRKHHCNETFDAIVIELCNILCSVDNTYVAARLYQEPTRLFPDFVNRQFFELPTTMEVLKRSRKTR